MITYKQLTLAEIFEDCQNKFDNDKYQFLSLLDETINLDEIVPISFVTHFHASTGRPRKHQLYPMLKAFLIQRIFSIPTDMLLIVFLKYSQELRDFCGFDVVPDASKFTRFKQDFLMDLQSMFDHMVDMTESICQKLDPHLAAMTIFDTSGIEAWVTENNPKYANRIIKQLKAFAKANNLDKSYPRILHCRILSLFSIKIANLFRNYLGDYSICCLHEKFNILHEKFAHVDFGTVLAGGVPTEMLKHALSESLHTGKRRRLFEDFLRYKLVCYITEVRKRRFLRPAFAGRVIFLRSGHLRCGVRRNCPTKEFSSARLRF